MQIETLTKFSLQLLGLITQCEIVHDPKGLHDFWVTSQQTTVPESLTWFVLLLFEQRKLVFNSRRSIEIR